MAAQERPVSQTEESEGKIKNLLITRRGHLRWLPSGQQFSDVTVVNYAEEQFGRDLFAKNRERQQEYKTSLNMTYVKSVKQREEDMPPQIIELPKDLLRFQESETPAA